MQPTLFPHDDDSRFEASLRGLDPSATPLDPAMVFYRMGLAAGRCEGDSKQAGVRSLLPAAAALLLAASLSAVVVGPVGYRLGRASAGAAEQSAPNAPPAPPTQPMLAEDHTERFSTPLAESSAAGVSPADAVSNGSHPLDTSGPPEPLTDDFATSIASAWPPFHAVIANWLLGNAVTGPLRGAAEPAPLAHQLLSGRGTEDLLADNLLVSRLPHTGLRSRPAPRPSTTLAEESRSADTRPVPKAVPSLRANDWKAVIDKEGVF